jgi:hypothetical protein
MGKILSGILGGVSGSVGPVVGAIVRGVPTIRNKPKKSSKPAVPSQIEQRSKFGMATKFIKSLKAIVEIGYQAYSKKMSASNAAVQELLNNAITGISPAYSIDFPNVILSKGSLYDAPTMAMLPPAADATINITWDPAELGAIEGPLHALDRAVFIFHDEQTKRFVLYNQVVPRSTGKYETELPRLFIGHKMHVWAFFVSPDLKSVSNSQYLGSIIPIQ